MSRPYLGFTTMLNSRQILACAPWQDVRFGSKADICGAKGHVRFTPNSDIDCVLRHVRFGPKRTHTLQQTASLFLTRAGLRLSRQTLWENPSAWGVHPA